MLGAHFDNLIDWPWTHNISYENFQLAHILFYEWNKHLDILTIILFIKKEKKKTTQNSETQR